MHQVWTECLKGNLRGLYHSGVLIFLLAASFNRALGQNVTTIPVGHDPYDIAINPATNRIYVPNGLDNTVTVINGATNATTTVPVGIGPVAAAANPVTNKIYVLNAGDNTVTVIDGTNNATTAVATGGTQPFAIAVNPATDTIYVVDFGGILTEINGITNAATTVSSGGMSSTCLSLDLTANLIWVGFNSTDYVTVIDGSTNAATNVALNMNSLVVDSGASLAINTATHIIYVLSGAVGATSANIVTAIDEATKSPIATIADHSVVNNGLIEWGTLVVNSVTNRIYVTNPSTNDVTVINGATNTTVNVPVGNRPAAIAVNSTSNTVYVANLQGSSVTVIDGPTNATTTVPVGNTPTVIAVNPVTNLVYVLNNADNTVSVFAGAGGTPTPTPTPIPTPTPTPPGGGGNGSARLINISTRAQVGTGANILIPGFVITGSGTETLLIRADGPALTGFGVAGALAQPSLSVFNNAGSAVATNTGWGTNSNPALITSTAASVGAFAFAPGSLDCALIASLPAGAYTVQVSGVGNTSGVGLAEVYEVSTTGTRLVNISTRAQVGTGANIIIAGFVIVGSGTEKLLVRADGPALIQFGVTGVLALPSLSVLDNSGTSIASNTGWTTGANPTLITSTDASVGAFALPAGSADSAQIVNLTAGAYTVQISGFGNTTGVALAEIYEAP